MKEELRKEFDIKFCYLTNEANFKTMITPADVFDWFYSKLEAKDKECASKIAAGERLRVEDAMSAINEANGLREKIKDQELIIYGIEEGAEQWKSLCADKDKEIAELREYKRLNTIGLSDYTTEELHDQIADLKAKLERMESIKELIDFQSKYDISMNFQFWGDKGVSVYIEKDGIDLNSFYFDTPEETIDAALKYLKRINKNP